MSPVDWWVLLGTTLTIIVVGVLRSRGSRTSADFLRGGNQQRWSTIGLSVMATQASAITFLSVPGQGYEDGMRFVQFYFGLPLAMVIISAVFVPIYYRLKVTTAYEYLESRFDRKTRLLAAALFLIQRGLSTGITIYAPAIILSAILGWPLEPTMVVMGGVVILYTLVGGAQTVSRTQEQQMVIMLGGMVMAAVMIVWRLPPHVSAADALDVAGALGRMKVVNFQFDLSDRYNFWSGITGGLFLQLSYFGTDQSQVGRYLGGRSATEGRLGLLFNGMLKIPMQFLILGVGVLVFVFYQFNTPPLLFNQPLRDRVAATSSGSDLLALEAEWEAAQQHKRLGVDAFLAASHAGDDAAVEATKAALQTRNTSADAVRTRAKQLVAKALPGAETKDSDYIFISFIKQWFTGGLLGLLIAVILAAAMSAIASSLSALGTTTTVDFYKRVLRPQATEREVLRATRVFMVLWGAVAVGFAALASLLDNLIQAVNILGSLFYGTVLGIFLVAFFLKEVRGHAVFVAAIVSQLCIFALYAFSTVGYLWFNLVGCALVMGLATLLQRLLPRPVH
jgi:Na+/proline symporter